MAQHKKTGFSLCIIFFLILFPSRSFGGDLVNSDNFYMGLFGGNIFQSNIPFNPIDSKTQGPVGGAQVGGWYDEPFDGIVGFQASLEIGGGGANNCPSGGNYIGNGNCYVPQKNHLIGPPPGQAGYSYYSGNYKIVSAVPGTTVYAFSFNVLSLHLPYRISPVSPYVRYGLFMLALPNLNVGSTLNVGIEYRFLSEFSLFGEYQNAVFSGIPFLINKNQNFQTVNIGINIWIFKLLELDKGSQ